jgi:hypothetical protein
MVSRRDLLKSAPASAFAISGNLLMEGTAVHPDTPVPPAAGHFHPPGQAPSKHVVAVLKAAHASRSAASSRP